MTSTFTHAVGLGRHRLGRPGLVSVTAFVGVVRRGFWASFFRPGRHRFDLPAPSPRHARSPRPAVAR